MTIQRPKPIIEQVAALLRQRILDHTYPPGSKLPSELNLAQELGVSRTTVRSVLARFATESLIFRKQGDGTYVNEQIGDVHKHYGGNWDFSHLIQANGFQPTIETLSLTKRSASPAEMQSLDIEAGSQVISMVRLFSANDRPVIHATNVFPESLLRVDGGQIDANMPIHELLQTYSDQQIAYVISDIVATTFIDGELKEILKRNKGQPILKLIETFHNKAHQPLILGTSFYDSMTLRLRLVQAWG